jgi:hypothetical protein
MIILQIAFHGIYHSLYQINHLNCKRKQGGGRLPAVAQSNNEKN